MTMQTGCDQLHIPVTSFASHTAETDLKTGNIFENESFAIS
jgi:hypothetical protein